MTLKEAISALIQYAILKHLMKENDNARAKLMLCTLFKIEDFTLDTNPVIHFETFMKILLDEANALGLFEPNILSERDAYEAKLMDMVMPSPKTVKKIFLKKLVKNSVSATDYLYQLCKDVNYIKTKRLEENISWMYKSDYGNLQMTINLAKPEKDPKEIALALEKPIKKEKNVPLCVLCKENEQNYHNARMNLRIVPIMLGGERWHFQYSPYLYYQEHAIVLHDVHRPMKISSQTFTYLLDFIDLFPSYFIGSNADLPIVGGSILNHDHFQAGKHHFPIEDAEMIQSFYHPKVKIEHIKWPLSTIRLSSVSRNDIQDLSTKILEHWKEYDNLELDILSHTGPIPHNTITPILRKYKDMYQMDLVLRNNRTSLEYPDGIFHPHADVHHIKKENIGLIEAMGLAILPGRLKYELEWIEKHHDDPVLPDALNKHTIWIEDLKDKSIDKEMLKNEVGKKFQRVIEDAGVFKLDQKGIDAMRAFISSIV